jgi:hypothetical protein
LLSLCLLTFASPLSVKATAEFDGVLGNSCASPPMVIWVTANPSPPGEVPPPTNIQLAYFSEELGVRVFLSTSLPPSIRFHPVVLMNCRRLSASPSPLPTLPSPLSSTSELRYPVLLKPSLSCPSTYTLSRLSRSTFRTAKSFVPLRNCTSSTRSTLRRRALRSGAAPPDCELTLSTCERARRSQPPPTRPLSPSSTAEKSTSTRGSLDYRATTTSDPRLQNGLKRH